MSEQSIQQVEPEGDGYTVRVKITSRREFLDSIHSLSEHLIEEVGFSEDDKYWLVTAVREAVTNAVIHGNEEQFGKHVEILFVLHVDRICITVTDQGAGFDPSRLPDPVSKEHLMDASGRGVFLMEQLMDEVTYTFPDSGGTTLTMMKRLRAKAAGDAE